MVVWDPRGAGRSSRTGPFDIATDAADFGAVCEAAEGGAVAVGIAYGTTVAVELAAERPDLVAHVVSPGGGPLLRGSLGDAEGFGASEAVIEMVTRQARADPRGAVRGIIASLNPQLDDQGARRRVDGILDYMDPEAMLSRSEDWIGHDGAPAARRVGERLTIVQHPFDPWLPLEALPEVRRVLPRATVLEAEDGPLSRPDITAELVRRITSEA